MPKDITALESINQRVTTINEQLSNIEYNLTAFLARAGGHPVAEGKNGPKSVPSGMIGALEENTLEANHMALKVRDLVEKLNSIC